MPTTRRYRGHRRRAGFGFDEERLHCLLTGIDYFGYSLIGDASEREAAMRGDWIAHRGEILAGFIKENPGTRPWAWWRFDSPEPLRRKMETGGIAMPYMRPGSDPGAGISFGLPAAWIVGGDDFGNRYETEAQFLARHRLLSLRERKVLAPSISG